MIKYFYNNLLKFDFINKFNYLDISNVPYFIEVCLIFQSDNFKNMLFQLIMLKTFSNKNIKMLLSFKNGNIIISKVFIKKKLVDNKLLIIFCKILPYIKLSKSFTFYVYDLGLIKILFKFPYSTDFIKLKMSVIFNLNTKQELRFIFNNF